MSRAFCVPGVFFIFSALVLNVLVSVSLPFLPALDIVRTHLSNGAAQGFDGLTEIRLGIWSACFYNLQSAHSCIATTHAYSFSVSVGNSGNTALIEASWTRGLLVHLVAAIATFIAFLFGLSHHLTMALIASVISFLAALLTLIAFLIDIALFALTKHEMKNLGAGISTKAGPGFWLTLASMLLLFLGSCTVCLGRRRDSRSRAATNTNTNTTPRPSLWQRLGRRNNNKV